MNMDTAVFLDVCERQATANQTLAGFADREITEDQVLIALLIASVDVLGKSTPRKVAEGFDLLKSTTQQVIHVAEEDGFTVIGEEM